MNYAERWRLAVATKQALPVPTETGDVAPTEPDTPTSSSGFSFTSPQLKIAFENLGKTVIAGVAVGAVVGLVVGGAIGYAVGRAK
jgi:hypothetical protein